MGSDDAILDALSRPLLDARKIKVKKLTLETPIETAIRIWEEAENDGPMNDAERRSMEGDDMNTEAETRKSTAMQGQIMESATQTLPLNLSLVLRGLCSSMLA